MRFRDVWREIVYPLTNLGIVFALLFFWMLSALVQNAHLFGIVLAFIVFPAYLRYLAFMLEARANGREPPVPSIEMFSLWDDTWALTPVIVIAAWIWAEIYLVGAGLPLAAFLLACAVWTILPASLAVLAITHGPLESLNPMALLRMIRACGPAYFLVPTVLVLQFVALLVLLRFGLPPLAFDLATSYQVALLFTFTGAVLRARQVAFDVDIGAPREPAADDLASGLERRRRQVSTHAYGFISRGNRDGGFAHIRQWIDSEADPYAAREWFFRCMLTWESNDAALRFGQDYLNWLVERDGGLAIKLIGRCLHENPHWRPHAADRDRVNALLERAGREDLLAAMRR